MGILNNIDSTIARDDSTAVRSHKSFDSQVEAICHHSGQYLTEDEAYHPIWQRLITRLLREQHDFPGLPELDRAFVRAAHATEHQHIVWSRIAIHSIARLILIPIVALLLLILFNLQDYVPLQFWYVFWGSLVLFALGSLAIVLRALARYTRREALFHKNASGLPPAVADYPLQGNLDIKAREQITIDLDNLGSTQPTVNSQRGKLIVKLVPAQGPWEDPDTYRQQYKELNVGEYMHGGTVALESLRHIHFLDDIPEYDHRLVLRRPTRQLRFNQTGQLPQDLTVETDYQILLPALLPSHNGLPRFPLEIEPRLSPLDSRTLELRFFWHGPDPTVVCRLDECVLKVPDILGKVLRVKYGRPDNERREVVWRNRSFREQGLVLSITFEQPVLDCHEILGGHYVFSYEGLLSGMEISADKIWNVLGRRVDEGMCHITSETSVRGQLFLNLQRLSLEHEHVKEMPPVVFELSPDENLVRAVTGVLLEEGFDLQRVTRSAPRLDPAGRLDRQLFYWDIRGRRYNEELLDAVDIHLVITGSDRIIQANIDDGTVKPYTHIDLRARCLHDPRDLLTPSAVDALIGGSGELSLAAKIKQAVMREADPQAHGSE